VNTDGTTTNPRGWITGSYTFWWWHSYLIGCLLSCLINYLVWVITGSLPGLLPQGAPLLVCA
jgi:hypothetical protein